MATLFPTFISLKKRLHSLLATEIKKPDIAALWAKFERAEEDSWLHYQAQLKV